MASRIIIEKRLAFREAALEKLYDAYTPPSTSAVYAS